MSGYPELGKYAVDTLSGAFTVTKDDIGSDARLRKGPVTLETETYNVSGVGHLCIIKMNAVFGIMKMETVALVPTEKDAPRCALLRRPREEKLGRSLRNHPF